MDRGHGVSFPSTIPAQMTSMLQILDLRLPLHSKSTNRGPGSRNLNWPEVLRDMEMEPTSLVVFNPCGCNEKTVMAIPATLVSQVADDGQEGVPAIAERDAQLRAVRSASAVRW